MLFQTKERAYDSEEQFIDLRSLFPKGLNSIPGGKRGLQFLASINALDGSTQPEPSARDAILDEFVTQNPAAQTTFLKMNHSECDRSASQSRPEMVDFWGDNENAARMITSRPDRLSIEQIRNARYDASLELSVKEIAEHIGARNVEIVRRLLEGKTYSRVS